MSRLILVDGYNVIHRNPQFRPALAQSLESARALLIAQLAQRYRYTADQVVVVFDGAESHEHTDFDRQIRVIYSRRGESADQVIARLARAARAAGQEVQLFSDDRAVRAAIGMEGGRAETAHALGRHLYAAPPTLARRFQYQMRMRALYGLDPAVKLEDLEEPPSSEQRQPGKRRKHAGRARKKRRGC
jgi:predicted RNA-binding protein with PIN domain